MNLPGSEANKRILAYVLVGVAVLALYYIYSQLWNTPTPPAPATAAITTTATPSSPSDPAPAHTARPLGTTAAALDPTLHMARMRIAESLTYSGTGRNIFSADSAAPVAIPKPVQSARPSARLAPVQLVPAGPPPPPPIDLRFCGYFAAAQGDRQVILVHGDDVVLAKTGDIVLRRYKVLSISPTSIQVEDLPNSNKQTLPLVTN